MPARPVPVDVASGGLCPPSPLALPAWPLLVLGLSEPHCGPQGGQRKGPGGAAFASMAHWLVGMGGASP